MAIGNVSNVAIKPAETGASTAVKAAGESSSFFGELIDIVNPLQHIPLVSNIYRALTDDVISPFANIAGGTLFGGPVGGGIAAASEIAKAGLSEVAKDETTTALADLSPAAGEASRAAGQYQKAMRVTTADWLNPNFDRTI